MFNRSRLRTGIYEKVLVQIRDMESRHTRRHDAISKMPTAAAGIVTEGANKWKTIIQNSNLYLMATNQRV